MDAIVEARGWERDPHKNYHDVERMLKHEIDNKILTKGMSSISLMRQNSIDDYRLSESWLKDCAEDIRSMVEAIEAVTYRD